MKSLTIWGNWCQTFWVGKDKFYRNLCNDVLDITIKLEKFAESKANTIEDLFNFFTKIIKNSNLQLIGDNIGHSIFKVKQGQTVEQTPISERIFIDKGHGQYKLQGILSIEPQLQRINPFDNKYYAAKHQRIVIH